MSLEDYGWSPFFSEPFEEYRKRGASPGRITAVHRGLWLVQTGDAEIRSRICRGGEFPAVGDWIAWRMTESGAPILEGVLPRRSTLRRKSAGVHTDVQVVAANVDTVFLVMGLDGDFNPRRMERLLTMTYDSGAVPVIVLNKADLCAEHERQRQAIASVALGAEILFVSAHSGQGMDGLRLFLRPGRTIALVGSSGAGKSTIINRLFGAELIRTAEVREKDSRGRHTTTHRELFKHPDGGLLIDNPGIREIQLWASEEALAESFDDIDALAALCRFSDCSHRVEPGCAVLEAVKRGTLPEERLNSYHKLAKEIRYLALRQDQLGQLELKRKWKIIHKAIRRHPKLK